MALYLNTQPQNIEQESQKSRLTKIEVRLLLIGFFT
jgi:hypothetical protein